MALHDYREDTEGAVDTWEVTDQQRAVAAGNFVVPDGVRAITELQLHAAPDFGAAAIISRLATAFRLTGPGLLTDHKPLYFVGPAGGITITTLGAVLALVAPIRVPVNIRVVPGQEIEGSHKFMGEDPGDVHGSIGLTYDGPVSTPVIEAAEVREDDLADATEAMVRIDTDVAEGTATQDFFAKPGLPRVWAVDYAVGVDVTVATRIFHQFELDGDGVDLTKKPQIWGGWAGYQALVGADGAGVALSAPERRIVDIPVKIGRANPIIARAGMVEDDYGAGTAVMGLLFTR